MISLLTKIIPAWPFSQILRQNILYFLQHQLTWFGFFYFAAIKHKYFTFLRVIFSK